MFFYLMDPINNKILIQAMEKFSGDILTHFDKYLTLDEICCLRVCKELLGSLKRVLYLAKLRKQLEKSALISNTFFPGDFIKRTIEDEDKLYAHDTRFDFEFRGKKIGYIQRQRGGVNGTAFSYWKACVYGLESIDNAMWRKVSDSPSKRILVLEEAEPSLREKYLQITKIIPSNYWRRMFEEITWHWVTSPGIEYLASLPYIDPHMRTYYNLSMIQEAFWKIWSIVVRK